MAKFSALPTRMSCLLELVVNGRRADFILLENEEQVRQLAAIINGSDVVPFGGEIATNAGTFVGSRDSEEKDCPL